MSNELFSLVFDTDSKVIRVGGELSFATVSQVLEQTSRVFEPVTDLKIDLAAVSRSDSAGLALLIDWMRTAQAANKSIVFQNIPSQMLAIASASGLDELLPLH
ncbi:sulfate transporter [Methylophaga sp. 41_12_T18]|nr:sulfate transporter [Methylophaga sp. 41_12_T18]